jgi:hypothetical protein
VLQDVADWLLARTPGSATSTRARAALSAARAMRAHRSDDRRDVRRNR